MKGGPLTKNILLECGNGGTVLYRQNTGQAFAGDGTIARRTQQVTLQPGDAVVRNARILHAGLCEGSSDIIGHETVTITPEMVGQKIAVFVAIEVKGEGDRPRPKQRDFVDVVNGAGGRAGFARSIEDAKKIIAGG